jgi:dTDP-4-dehydrorhamnose reductase
MNKVLVTGSNGQLGRDLMLELAKLDNVEFYGIDINNVDITDRGQLFEICEQIRPDFIIHGAAFTNVDLCESEQDTAFKVNAIGTRNVAQAADLFNAHACYVSTDYVFDGRLNRPYIEWDRPNPLSVYGRSKYAGEMEMTSDGIIARTSWVCGFWGNNIVKTVIKLANEKPSFDFVDDQIGQPTFCEPLAKMLIHLTLNKYKGVFHVTNQGPTSWYGFARQIVEYIGKDPDMVKPIKTEQLNPPRPAIRPKNSVLENMALKLYGISLLDDWKTELKRLILRLKNDSP